MNTVYLKKPSELDENNYYDYIDEFMKYSNDKKVFCVAAQKKYKKWLKEVNSLSKGTYRNIEPITIYFLIDNDQIIGHVAIKNKLIFSKADIIAGNITGTIRPSMRNKGYGRKMLSLALEKCKELELEEVFINCTVDNIGSNKNIIDNGGVIQKILYDPSDNTKYRQYKIKIKK